MIKKETIILEGDCMMKSLQTIQTLSKIGKILSKIIYICCTIGAVGCAIGMASLPFADTGVLKIGGVTIHGLIVNRAGIDLNSLYPLMTGAMIVCIGQTILAKFAENYFTHELAVGSPFTVDGAKELLRLGILTICIPLGCLIAAEIVSGIMAGFLNCDDLFKSENVGSVTLGVMFIVMSILCRYGAELEMQKQEDGSRCE